jgi:hypothetical protein
MTETIRYPEEEHPDDDPEHPIPSIHVVDAAGFRAEGGADLIILVASPLDDSQYSLTRLLDKIEAYLHYINSHAFQAEAGEPNPGNTTIRVLLHPGSAPEAYDLLERSKAWAAGANARLEYEDIGPEFLEPDDCEGGPN